MCPDWNTEDRLRKRLVGQGLVGNALNRAVAHRLALLRIGYAAAFFAAFALFGDGIERGEPTARSALALIPILLSVAFRFSLIRRGETTHVSLANAPTTRGDELVLGVAWKEECEATVTQMKGVAQADRAAHMYVVGGSGSGKTTFLQSLVVQDIRRKHGFAVIDPHGDLVADILGRLALIFGPQDAFLREQVIVIDPTHKTRTAAFNPLERMRGISSAEQAAELVGVFKKIWADSWGVRMEDLLRNTLIALSENNLTLAEIPLFLSGDGFRARVMRRVEHPICRTYFTRFDSLTARVKSEWSEPILNKVNAILSDERVRHIFSATKSSFDLRAVMDEGKILLLSLDRGRLKGGGDLLGALLAAKIQMAAFARTDTPPSKRRQFYLYMDEFQNFATESFVETLAEARKYRLALIMAHQNLAQLPKTLKASIMANCGLHILFRLSREDAQTIAKESLHALYDEAPTWETHIQLLQKLPPRVFFAHNKQAGGVVLLSALDTPAPYTETGMEEETFRASVAALRIGEEHLRDRSAIERETRERQREFLLEREDPESNRQ